MYSADQSPNSKSVIETQDFDGKTNYKDWFPLRNKQLLYLLISIRIYAFNINAESFHYALNTISKAYNKVNDKT